MPSDLLGIYFRDLKHHPVLARDEEHALAVEYRRTGRPELASRLAAGHLRLVVKIAKEYRRSSRDFADLIEQGNVGLLLAITKFDPLRDVRLSTYAAFWIRALILKYVADNRRLVRIGTTRAQRSVVSGLARESRAGEEGLAARLGVTEDELAGLAQHLRVPELSLDTRLDSGDRRASPVDKLATPEPGPDAQAEAADHRAVVRQALAEFDTSLDPRERILLHDRWLVDETSTLQQIGDRFGISRERVRQIEQGVLCRLRTFLTARAIAA